MAACVNEERATVSHLVADSAAFIKNAPLHEMCEDVYTVQDVVSEIRDAATRQRLSVLPYNIVFKEPSSEAIHVVTEFAKLTGDFRTLSAVDLRVMALTYQLEKEHCGTEHIRTKPITEVEFSKEIPGNKMPGFYMEKGQEAQQNDNDDHDNNDIDEPSTLELPEDDSQTSLIDPLVEENSKTLDDELDEIMDLPGCTISPQPTHLHPQHGTSNILREQAADSNSANADIQHQGIGNDDEIDEDMDDTLDEVRHGDNGDDEGFVEEDEEGWITPSNLHLAQQEMGLDSLEPTLSAVSVGCLTTDFAMQNVLIQMGLHVVSIDGMLIREAKSYVLKCYSCFRVCTQIEKVFCPSCGNKTLAKVTMSVDEKGVTHYNVPNRKRPFNIRGKKYPIPLPKGGRHDDGPILCEDSPSGQRHLPRKKDKVDALQPDYVARASPFAARDVTSRAAQLGLHLRRGPQERKNPNEVRKKSGRRKK